MDADVEGGEPASNDLPAAAAVVISTDRPGPRDARDATIPEPADAQPAGPGAAIAGAGAAVSHLVPLTGDWALWRWVCLRAPGFAFDRHDPLGAPRLAEAADRHNKGDVEAVDYDALFARTERELSVALHAAAADPRFRRAIAWQNRTALATGIDALLRRDPHTVNRNSRYRQYETLVANYLQRYTAKNDTIGFFGPVGWVHIVPDGPAVQLRPLPGGTLARRALYLEDWAGRLLAEALSPGLEPWLVPRRLPIASVREDSDGFRLELPFAPPVPLSALDARVMVAIDGGRTATEVVSVVAGEPAAVWAALARLRDLHAIAWEFDVSAADVHSLRTLRERLETVTDAALREPALAALDEMDAAVARLDEVAARPEDDGDLLGALESLDETFSRLTGAAPTRRAGKIYAGRTLAFQDARRGDDVTFGASLFESLAAPLELVLTAARWYTAAGAALFERACLTAQRERVRATGRPEVPLAELWLDINNFLFDEHNPVVARMDRAIRERWAGVFTVPEGERRVRLRAADLRDAVMKAFAVGRAGWATGVHHSPDLMIAAASAEAIRAGDFEWVLGEIHPGLHTTRYVTWMEQHPEADEVRRAMHDDLGGPVIWAVDTASYGATPARLTNALTHPTDRHLAFATDSCGYAGDRVLHLGDFDTVEEEGRLRVVSRVTGERLGIVDLLGDLLASDLAQFFGIVPSAAHTPRITIDRLVVHRETWRFAAADLPWAHTVDERARYLAARRFVTDHDLPRYVFLRTQGENKPVFVDLTSLSSIELLSRAVRRARSHAGDGAKVTFGEMLPSPDQLWLTDAEGRRYTAELRICATDRKGR